LSEESQNEFWKEVLEEESLLERGTCEMAKCGLQLANRSMPTKAAKQQDIVMTGERKWEAMARKWSEKPLEKESEEHATHIYNNTYTTKTVTPSFVLFS
jgi:hypothetical protein